MFKAGDKVKFINAEDAKLASVIKPEGTYTVREINVEKQMLNLENVFGDYYISRFILAEPEAAKEPKPHDAIDNVCTYSDRKITGSVEAAVHMVDWFAAKKKEAESLKRDFQITATGFKLFDHALSVGEIEALSRKEIEAISPRQCPPVTRIIHNGTTTITFFSDGSKMVTRPSKDDTAKYDPFVGWCVGVTEKLYGGKKQAKEFYASTAEVVKPVSSEPERRCEECFFSNIPAVMTAGNSPCVDCHKDCKPFWRAKMAKSPSETQPKAQVKSCDNCEFSKTSKCPWEGTYHHMGENGEKIGVCNGWQPKQQPEPSEKRKEYDQRIAERPCCLCLDKSTPSNAPPCKGCWTDNTKGYHPNFAPKPFKE